MKTIKLLACLFARAAALPEVPTIAELVKIMHAAELQERLAVMATEPATGTPEQFGAYIRQEIAKWGDVVRKAGLKAD